MPFLNHSLSDKNRLSTYKYFFFVKQYYILFLMVVVESF